MGVVGSDEGAPLVRLPRKLSGPAIHALLDELRAAERGPADVTTLVGADGMFCEGLDLACAGPKSAGAMQLFVEVLFALVRSPKPTLAVVTGNAYGGGLGILCACDVAVADERARFALPEALYGFLPAAIYPLLAERLSPQKIRLLIVEGVSRDAAWALRHGLIDEAVAPNALERSVRGWTRRLQRTGRSAAIPMLRALSRRNRAVDLEQSIRDGAAETVTALAQPGLASRLQAFEADGLMPWEAS